MGDSFKEQQEKIRKMIDSVNRDLQKRSSQKREGRPTGMVDSEIRSQLITINNMLETLSALVENQLKNPGSFNIIYREAERRKNQYQELVNKYEEAKARFEEGGDIEQQMNFKKNDGYSSNQNFANK